MIHFFVNYFLKHKDIVYGGIVLIMALLLVFQLWKKPIKTENNVATIIAMDNKPADLSIDFTGKSHASKQVIYLKDEHAILLYRNQLDSVSKQLKIQNDKIAGLTTLSGRAEHKFNTQLKVLRDSLNNIIESKIDYHSKWFDLHGTAGKDNNFNFKATIRDSITIAFVKKKFGFMGLREHVYADAHSANKDMVIQNIKSWEVPELTNNKSKIGFGATAGYGFQLSRQHTVTHGFQLTGGIQIRF